MFHPNWSCLRALCESVQSTVHLLSTSPFVVHRSILSETTFDIDAKVTLNIMLIHIHTQIPTSVSPVVTKKSVLFWICDLEMTFDLKVKVSSNDKCKYAYTQTLTSLGLIVHKIHICIQ